MSEIYGIMGEDSVDAEVLKILTQRILAGKNPKVHTKGYDGCGQLMNKGARQLTLFHSVGCTKFIICHDSDRREPSKVRSEVFDRIVKPSALSTNCCTVVPVQEIEAWILADIGAISNIISGWKPRPIASPEAINDPKEYLEKLSRKKTNRKPKYDHTYHNAPVSRFLSIDLLTRKCDSFRFFHEFLTKFDKNKSYV